jgi:hypothetical protein
MANSTFLLFLLNFVVGGGILQKVIASLVHLQIVLFQSLVLFPMPGNINSYYSKIKPIVTFNVVKFATSLTPIVFEMDSVKQIEL